MNVIFDDLFYGVKKHEEIIKPRTLCWQSMKNKCLSEHDMKEVSSLGVSFGNKFGIMFI